MHPAGKRVKKLGSPLHSPHLKMDLTTGEQLPFRRRRGDSLAPTTHARPWIANELPATQGPRRPRFFVVPTSGLGRRRSAAHSLTLLASPGPHTPLTCRCAPCPTWCMGGRVSALFRRADAPRAESPTPWRPTSFRTYLSVAIPNGKPAPGAGLIVVAVGTEHLSVDSPRRFDTGE